MTLSPLESRISTLRQEARLLVTNGATREQTLELLSALWAARFMFFDGLEWEGTSAPVRSCVLKATEALASLDVGGGLSWLEQCAAHLASERLAQQDRAGGCFGVRP